MILKIDDVIAPDDYWVLNDIMFKYYIINPIYSKGFKNQSYRYIFALNLIFLWIDWIVDYIDIVIFIISN